MFLISIKLVYLLYYVVVVDAAELASDACCKVLEACSDEVLSQLETGQNQNKVWKIVKEKAPKAGRRADSSGKVLFSM